MRRLFSVLSITLPVLAALIAASPAAAQTPPPTRRLDEQRFAPQMAEMIDLMKAHRFADAVARADEIDRAFTDAHRNGPVAYCSRGGGETLLELTQASTRNVSAVAIGTTWCEALYMKAYALVELGRPADAATVLDRVLTLAPFHSVYLSERGELRLRAKQFDAAMETFRRAEEHAGLTPNADAVRSQKARACRGIGFALIELGRLDEAAENYRRCLTIDPGDRKSLQELGYIASLKAKKN